MSLRTFTATQFREPMNRGFTHPFLVLATDNETREELPLVVKPNAGYGNRQNARACEVFSLMLARELGIPAVEPVIVELPKGIEYGALDYGDFNGADYPELIRQSHGKNLATVHLGTDWKPWTATTPPRNISSELMDNAYAYDAMVQNNDRAADNPNILWKGEELVTLDYDRSFAFLGVATGNTPWREFLPRLMLNLHCLHPHVRKSLPKDTLVGSKLWEAFEGWKYESSVQDILDRIEKHWHDSSLDFSGIETYLASLASSITDFFEYLTAHTVK